MRRAIRAWKLARKMPWLGYCQAWRCCSGRRPAAILGHMPIPEADDA